MTSFLGRLILGSLICLSSIASAQGPSRASIRHIEGGGIGYSQGYTTIEAFLASDPNRWSLMTFIDARGHLFDDGKWAANGGGGIRKVSGSRAYGLNAYYDYRNTSRANYNQIGFGFESLGKCLDFRINGYIPVGQKSSALSALTFDRFSENFLILSQRYQFAMKGVDAELGFHLGNFRRLKLYAAAGPYYYINQIGGNTWGGKGRISCRYNDNLALEISNSYDNVFHNRFQGQLTFSIPLGGTCCSDICNNPCQGMLLSRMAEPVIREEIIVLQNTNRDTIAIDPLTGEPLFFVFVDNTSSSDGTFESPYPTLALAEANSAPGNYIYVFPGDGTTTGMDSGITLKANQKFWGSGISHVAQTTAGRISIPAQSSSTPTITNTNVDTEGNAITLATNNSISGFNITSALNDAIYGADPQNLDVSFCTFVNTTTFAIESTFSDAAAISLTNNQFLNNVNGIFLTLNGTSAVLCSNNLFTGQTSVSEVPLAIVAENNIFSTLIENNIFDNNTTGSVRFALNNVDNANIILRNNTMTNNGTGSQSSLGSSFVVISSGTTDQCTIALEDNSFSGNTSNSLYMHTSGQITALGVTASSNIMSDNGGSALVLATPTNTLTLLATENTITGINDNGIAVISSGLTANGNIAINNNTITDVGNASNGIAINQDFTTLNLAISSNVISGCEGTGIISYAPSGIDLLTLDISGNTINNCQNLSSNAASGIDIEQYTNFEGTVINNTLSGNTGVAFNIGSILPTPTTCLTLSGNTSTDYLLVNPVDGTFNLAPCNVNTINSGTITEVGVITHITTCPGGAACPP